MKFYSDLIAIPTFKGRYEYLKLPGEVGIQTFGFERFINQSFYHSAEWREVRRKVILRDEASDLAMIDRPIYGHVRVHHINPISAEDFEHERFDLILEPENLVCVSLDTHNAIHYGTEAQLKIPLVERKLNDTKIW